MKGACEILCLVVLLYQNSITNVNGQIGIINNQVYRIESQQDATLLDLWNWITTNGNMIVNMNPNGSTAQLWRVTAENGGYRIASRSDNPTLPTAYVPVVHKNPLATSAEVTINAFFDGPTQKWEFVLVAILATGTNPNVWVIRNTSANCVLQNNGLNQRVTCVPFNPAAVPNNQRWRLI